MGDHKYEYDKIYDDVYDEEQNDLLTVEKSKKSENIRTNLKKEKMDENSSNLKEQIDQMNKQFEEKEENKTDIIKEVIQEEEEEKSLSNNNSNIISQDINGNADTPKHKTYIDMYVGDLPQAESSKIKENETNVTKSNGLLSEDYVCETCSHRLIREKVENKETVDKMNDDMMTQTHKEMNNISNMPTEKKERYNIYEHCTLTNGNELIKRREVVTDININNVPSQNTNTVQNDKTETKANTEYIKEKSEEKTEKSEEKKDKNESRNTFECNICFDDVRDPVVTKCGHLFCWGCLSSWIKKNNDCPVCKAEVLRENVIPLYGRGARSNEHSYKNSADEPRPTPNRKEPTRRARNGSNNVGLRALGVWVNPFSFALSYTNMSEEPYFGDNTTENRRVQTETYQAEIASSFFFFLGCFISLYLFFFPS